MKRSGPPKRKTPLSNGSKGLSRGVSQLKRSWIKQRSDKRAEFMRDVRVPQVRSLVEGGARCEVGDLLIKYGLHGARNCRGKVEGMHERRKRSAGGSLTNPANLVPACNVCNGWVEDNPDDAYILGLVVRQGDDEFDQLGARNG